MSLVPIENRTARWCTEAEEVAAYEKRCQGQGRPARGPGDGSKAIFFVVFGTSIGLCKFCAIDFKLLKYGSIALNIHGLWLSSIAFYCLFGCKLKAGFCPALSMRTLICLRDLSRGFPLAFIQVGLYICFVGWRFSGIWYHHNCRWKMMKMMDDDEALSEFHMGSLVRRGRLKLTVE